MTTTPKCLPCPEFANESWWEVGNERIAVDQGDWETTRKRYRLTTVEVFQDPRFGRVRITRVERIDDV